jgi:6-phosphogluconolactonase
MKANAGPSSLLICSSIQAQDNKSQFYCWTYTNGCDSKGIYVYDLILRQVISILKNTSENIVTSYLTVSNDNSFVYLQMKM